MQNSTHTTTQINEIIFTPITNNRFIVYFEDDNLSIPSFLINGFTPIHVLNCYPIKEVQYSPIVFNINTSDKINVEQHLFKYFDNTKFTPNLKIKKIKIDYLDATGYVIMTYNIIESQIRSLSTSHSSWQDTRPRELYLEVIPSDIQVIYPSDNK